MQPDDALTLRAFQDADKQLLQRWLYLEHVAKWYTQPLDWLDEIERRNDVYDWIHHFIVMLNRVPIGFCQYYEYCKGGENWHGDADIAGAYSIDYLIGEPEHIGKGLGKGLIAALIGRIRLHENAKTILVQPAPENLASCGALLAAGFQYDKDNRLYTFTL